MNNKELFCVLMLTIAVWLIASAIWTLCSILVTVATTPRSEIPTMISAFESLRNVAFVQLWIGTLIGLYGLTYAGGGKDFEIDDWFYWCFLIIAGIGSFVAVLV